MAVIPVSNADLVGANPPTENAGTGTDSMVNDGRTVLHVENVGAGPETVTVAAVGACNHLFLHDVVVTIPAGSERAIGPFPVDRFGASLTVTGTNANTHLKGIRTP